MEMKVLAEEEVAVAEVVVDSGTLMEMTILSHQEVAVVAVEDLVEVIRMVMMKVVVDLAAPEVVLVVDSNHSMKMEMMTLVEASEGEEVDLEGTGVVLTLQVMTNQDLVTDEVVEVLETEEVDSTLWKIVKKILVALATREAEGGLDVVDLVLQMTMKMKILEDLATEGAVVVLETGGVDLTLWMVTMTIMRILGALAAEEVEEDLEVEEEALALQMTMMMMVVLKDLVTEEDVVVLVEAEEDLVPIAMTERRTQAHVVVLAPDEEGLVDLNHPMMEKTQKGLAAREAVVLVDLEQLMKMMVNPEDVGEAEVAVDVVAPATVTLMMAISTLQNLV